MATPYYPWEEDEYGAPSSAMPAAWDLPYYAEYDIGGDDQQYVSPYYPEYQQPQQLPPTRDMPEGYWGKPYEREEESIYDKSPYRIKMPHELLMEQMEPRIPLKSIDQMTPEEIDRMDPTELDRMLRAQGYPAIPNEKSMFGPIAARVAPALAGGAYGASVGGIPGAMIGAGIGGFLGEGLGQYLGDEEFNPVQMGVQGLIAGATAPLGAARPLAALGARPGMGAVARYAGKEALLGTGLGAASTIPTELAASGNLPSWGQVGEGALFGGVTGGAVGAGIGRYFPERIPAGIPNSRISNLADEIDRSMGNTPPPPYGGGGVLPPDQYSRIDDLSDLIDSTLNEGPPAGAAPMPPTGGGPGPIPPNMGGAAAAAVPPTDLPPIILRRKWDQGMIEFYTQQGYVASGGGETDPNGFAFMKLPDANILPNARGATMDNPSAATIKTMQDQGYAIANIDPDGRVTMVYKAEPQKPQPKQAAGRPIPTPKEQMPSLPRELAGARPRYQSYELVFDNDIDLAAYIIAQRTKSPRDDEYWQFLRNASGPNTTDDDIRKLGEAAKTNIGRQVKGQPKGSTVELARIFNWKNAPPPPPRTAKEGGMLDQLAKLGGGRIIVGKDELTKIYKKLLEDNGYRQVAYDEKTGKSMFARAKKETEGASYPGAMLRAIQRYQQGGFRALFLTGEHAELPNGALLLERGDGANTKFYFAHPEQVPEPQGPFFTEGEAVYAARQVIKDVPNEPVLGGGRVAPFATREHDFDPANQIGSRPQDINPIGAIDDTPDGTADSPIMSFPNKGTPGSEGITYLSDVPRGPNDRTVPSDFPGATGRQVGPYDETPARAIQADKDEIRHVPSAGHARLLVGYWTNEARDAVAAQDLVRARHANDMAKLAQYRMNELTTQETLRAAPTGPGALNPNARLADIGAETPRVPAPDPETLAHTTGRRWAEAVQTLDSQNAPDESYKYIPNRPNETPLGPGETHRGRAIKAIGFFEESVKSRQGADFTPPGGVPRPPSGAGPSGPGGGMGGGDMGGAPPMGPSGGFIEPMDPVERPTFLQKLWAETRGATTTWDLSAPLRQGLPLIWTRQYKKALKTMFDAFGSEGAYERIMDNIKNRELFKSDYDELTGKRIPSWAETRNLSLTDLDDPLLGREENMVGKLFETGKPFDLFTREPGNRASQAWENVGGEKLWARTGGAFARKSNRAYTAFLNQLRADTFESLIDDARRVFEAGSPGARNPDTDIEFGKEIADFVNTATGRGPLKLQLPGAMTETNMFGKSVQLPINETNMEWAAPFLTKTLFSPRLFAARMRMMNPATYIMADPFVRKQYLKSMLATTAGWATVSGLAAQLPGVSVSMDPGSADFGKIRVGNTRLDPAGGFQQYVVAAYRLMTGNITSSATQRGFELGQGYRADTRKDVAERFGANKLHPVLKFAYDLLNASKRMPFTVNDRVAQMFVPLIAQDVMELAQEDPKLLPFIIPPTVFGMGTQTYGDRGEAPPRVLPQWMDPSFEGGNPLTSWQMGASPRNQKSFWK